MPDVASGPVALMTPDGDRLVEAERVADGDGPLADPQGVGVAEAWPPSDPWSGWKRTTARSVLGSVPTICPRYSRLSARRDRDLVGALDDVEVGEDVAALVDDDARAQPGPAELGARPSGPSEPKN